MRGKVTLITMLASAFLLVACIHNDPTTKATPRTDPTSETPAGSANDDEAKLRKLLTGVARDTYTATYEADGSSLGYPDEPGEPHVTLKLHIAQRGADHSRTTIAFTADQATNSFTVIITPDTTAFCTEELGTFAFFIPFGDKMCIDARDALDGNDALARLNILDTIQKKQFEVIDVSQGTVVGESATCYRVRDDDPHTRPDDDGVFCWSDDGRLLSMGGTTDDSGVYLLTEMSDDVASTAFDLPYPLTVLPSLEIVNGTDVSIFVHGSSKESGDLIDGQVEIAAQSKGTLRAGLRGTPTSIYLGTYEIPQWDWGCTWDDAKAHEPLVVKDQRAGCANTSSP